VSTALSLTGCVHTKNGPRSALSRGRRLQVGGRKEQRNWSIVERLAVGRGESVVRSRAVICSSFLVRFERTVGDEKRRSEILNQVQNDGIRRFRNYQLSSSRSEALDDDFSRLMLSKDGFMIWDLERPRRAL